MTRDRMPNRRPAAVLRLSVPGDLGAPVGLTIQAGYDPAGRVREVFVARTGAETVLKSGQFGAVLEDAAVIVSVALQHGVPLDALRKSLARRPLHEAPPRPIEGGQALAAPASLLGALLDALADLDGEVAR
jgi:ribonucleoside-diphosphate reductase alpha chain